MTVEELVAKLRRMRSLIEQEDECDLTQPEWEKEAISAYWSLAGETDDEVRNLLEAILASGFLTVAIDAEGKTTKATTELLDPGIPGMVLLCKPAAATLPPAGDAP